MPEYQVEVGFWLRAYDSSTITASSDEEAVEIAKIEAKRLMELTRQPSHIDTDERREGLIVWIDQMNGDRREVALDVEFDDDRIHPSEKNNA